MSRVLGHSDSEAHGGSVAGGLTGPLRWLWAIANSDLDRTEKHVCTMLLCWANFDTGEAWPALASLAEACSMNPNALRRVLKRLVVEQVLVFVETTRGGVDAAGRGKTNRVRLMIDRLLSRGANVAADPNPRAARGLVTPEPPRPVRQTPAPDALNPRAARGEQTNEQTNQQTTTTTTLAVARNPDRDREGGHDEGGGGGGRCAVGGRADLADRLVKAGVNRSEAGRLAALPRVTDDLVAFVCKQAQKPSVKHPGKLIAGLLRKPLEELDGWEGFRKKRLRQRTGAYERVLRQGGSTTKDKEGEMRAVVDLIDAAWIDYADLAERGPLLHDEVCDDRPDVAALFDRVVAAARQHAEQSPPRLEACPDDGLQCQRDQRQPHAGKEVPWPA
ncbi:MAG TPA: hypothetical protein PKE29_13625 [Phycisphaerales bacterium]|nr:hypothetical protein [Phycisphaerales bacterium]